MSTTMHASTGISTSPFQALQDDFLSALELVKERFSDAPIHDILSRTKLRLQLDEKKIGFRPATFLYKEGRITIQVSPVILGYPRIERVEFHLWFVCEAWKFISELPWMDFKMICCKLGCDYSHVGDPRERWRWICSLPNQHTFLIWRLEDRPRCLMCDRVMPTGSDCHPTRREVHENCGYDLDVLQEAIERRAREMEKGDVSQ